MCKNEITGWEVLSVDGETIVICPTEESAKRAMSECQADGLTIATVTLPHDFFQ